MLLCRARVAARKTACADDKGVDSGNYNIHQTVEFGYRPNEVNGNQNTYDTFINLGSGVRLFDYTLDMRSLNHQGFLFDDLSFSNFGYGGDPNDVSRLHIDKNKWYDFHLLFRRDKNFWDYNLFANPLNPAALNPGGFRNHRLHRQPADLGASGSSGVLLESVNAGHQFAAHATISCAACRITI